MKTQIKVIKRGEIETAPTVEAKPAKRSAAQTINGWIADYRTNKETERKAALQMLFGTN